MSLIVENAIFLNLTFPNLKSRKTLSNWLTNRYLLIIRNEENFAEKITLSFNYAKLLVFILITFVIFMLISLALVKTILAQWYDPRHAQLEANKKLIELNLALDSLEDAVDNKNRFIANFQRIVSGDFSDAEANVLSAEDTELLDQSSMQVGEIQPIDSQFRKEFEESEFDLLTIDYNEKGQLQEIFFFSPISGIISQEYEPQKDHYGVDIVSKKNEPVRAVADGTVVFADFDFSDSGYVLGIQHRNNLLSIYKHNSALLKKVGNFVSAGEIIAIIGNTGDLTTGPHLHFELWHNGNPVDPEEFVSF